MTRKTQAKYPSKLAHLQSEYPKHEYFGTADSSNWYDEKGCAKKKSILENNADTSRLNTGPNTKATTVLQFKPRLESTYYPNKQITKFLVL
jgi:hypothetical protein